MQKEIIMNSSCLNIVPEDCNKDTEFGLAFYLTLNKINKNGAAKNTTFVTIPLAYV